MKPPKVLLIVIAVTLIMSLAGCDLVNQKLRGTTGKISPQATLVVSRTGSMAVDINGGIISVEDGAEVEIPLGALGDRVVSVSIEKDDKQTVFPPEGFSAGPVYNFGPDGTTFNLPVRVSLPIPAGRDPSIVLGVLTLDPVSNERVALPGVVDTVKRIISFKTTHFSPYAVYWPATPNASFTGGYVKLINVHVQGSDNYVQDTPRSTTAGTCSGKPRTVGRGIYFLSYNPNDLSTFVRPDSDRIYAFDEQTVLYWLPAGTYTVVEFEWSTAINSAPLDSPCQKWMIRPPQIITVKANKTTAFGSYNTVRLPVGFTESADVYIQGTEQSTMATSDGAPEAFVVVESDWQVMIGPTKPTTFIVTVPWTVTLLQTYHYNLGEGATPGTIALRSSTGTLYGPWEAHAAKDPAGVVNGFWRVELDVVIPAGTYNVIDSSPATWSQNKATNGRGMTRIYGTPN